MRGGGKPRQEAGEPGNLDAAGEARNHMGHKGAVRYPLYGNRLAGAGRCDPGGQYWNGADPAQHISDQPDTRTADFCSTGIVYGVIVADSVLSVSAPASGTLSHGVASHRQLGSVLHLAVIEAVFLGTSGRNCGKADVYHPKDPAQWAAGGAGEHDLVTGAGGMDGAAYGNRGLHLLVFPVLAFEPEVV